MPVVPLQLTGRPDIELTADCSRCFALCCSALGFERSSDFAHDKPIGQACHNLADDFSCGIHDRLRAEGYRGCTSFDCFGAGQQVAQQTFDGVSWTAEPASRKAMFAAFPVMRHLHEFLWYLDEALELHRAGRVPEGSPHNVAALLEEIAALTRADADALVSLEVDALRPRIGEALTAVSAAARRGVGAAGIPKRVRPGADLMGADLADRPLRGADLRGAYLIAADLRGADLAFVDLLGADLRDARLQRADLSHSLYLTPMQVAASHGDADTRLPARLERPAHWPKSYRL